MIRRSRLLIILLHMGLATLCCGGTASAFEFSGVDVHGFLSQGYLKSTEFDFLGIPTKEGTFAYNEAAVNFSGQLSEKLRLGLQLFARDFGSEGNHDVRLDWAVGDYRWNDRLGIRFGKVKMSMGFYNQGRDVDMLRTCILLPQSIYYERMRDMVNAYLGGEIYGVVEDPFGGSLEYELFGGTMDIDEAAAFKDFLVRGALNAMPAGSIITLGDTTAECRYLVGGILRWCTPLESLRLGFSILHCDSTVKTNLITSIPLIQQLPILQLTSQVPSQSDYKIQYMCVMSAEVTRKDLTVVGEVMIRENRLQSAFDLGIPGVPSTVDVVQKYMALYGQVCYRVSDRFELGTYYSIGYADANDKDGDSYAARGEPRYYAWQKDLALSLRFDITPHWLVKAEAHWIDGAALVKSIDYLDDGKRYWGLFGVKTTINF